MQNKKRTGNPAADAAQDEAHAQRSGSMTNLQLLDEIDKLFVVDSNNKLDTEKLDAYLDLLQERAPVAEDYDPKLAWEVFKQNNASLLEDDSTDVTAEQAKTPAQRRPRFRRLICSIAAAAAMICMVAMVSNADFRTWIREAYEGSFVYRFFNSEETPEVLPDYEITNLPEGYTLIYSDLDEISGIKIYENSDSQIILTYGYADDGSNIVIIPKDDFEILVSPVYVNDQSADFYVYKDGDNANMLLWFSKDGSIVFSISSFLAQDTIVQMAESISAKELQ